MKKQKFKICIQIGDCIYESNSMHINFENENFLFVHKNETIVIKNKLIKIRLNFLII